MDLTPSPHPYTLHVAGLSHAFEVASFRGRERLSRPHVFDLSFITTRRIAAAQGTLLGRDAVFTIHGPTGARDLHGVIVGQTAEGHPSRNDRRIIKVRLASRVWLLSRRRSSRIFQGMNVVAIVGTLLRGVEVSVTATLDRRYSLLDYCVQYRETDLAFMQRILAEHGVAWRLSADEADDERSDEATSAELAGVTVFGRSSDDVASVATRRERVLLFDRAERYSVLAAPLLFEREQEGGAETEERVRDLSQRARAQSTRVATRSYDFRQPGAALTTAASTLDGRRSSGDPIDLLGLEVYDHQDEYLDPVTDRPLARVDLDRHRARALVCDGTSSVRALEPGARFTLEGHTFEEFNRAYAITEVSHEGEVPELRDERAEGSRPVYRNRFRCVPAEVMARPRHAARAPVQVVETATVVGPPDERVYTDEHARVRVRFHWDRRGGASPEESTAWLRVAQQWAGPSHGAQFIPRVGMEVLVTFLDGDPDRPVVTGCLYNGAAPPPFALPHERHRSGWRTDSVGAAGHNELSFEDTAGAEEVFLRAQRDLNERVGRDRTREVAHDERVEVRADQHVSVRGDRRVSTDVDRHERVGRDANLRVDRDHRVDVHGSQHETVRGRAERVVREDERTEVVGSASSHVRGDEERSVGGHAVTRVGTHERPATWAVHVEDRIHLHAARSLTLSADASLTLQVGHSVLRITPERIELVSAELRLAGEHARVTLAEGRCRIAAEDQCTVRAGRVLLRGAGAGLGLSTEAALEGAQVLLNSPVSVRDRVEDPSAEPTRVCLQDESGRPVAGRHFVLRTGDGQEFLGVLGRDGRAELDVRASGTIHFPGVDVE